jgi:hypothetical protein
MTLPSTTATVLAALSALHGHLIDDAAFCGYDGGPEATARLLAELWVLAENHYRMSAADLVVAWYDAALSQAEVA